jgi:MFS family permease
MWILRTTGSTAQFAMTFIAMEVPSLLVSPLAGVLVDRWDRRRMMIVCDCLSGLNMVVLAALLAAGHLRPWHIYVGVGLASLCDTFHSPAFSASIPQLATRDQLPRVNGLVQTGNAVAAIFGPLLAGVMVSAFSLYGVFLIDASTFLVAATALAASRIRRPDKATDPKGSNILREALIGWRYIYQRPGLLGLLAISGVNSFVFSMAGVLITPLLMSFSDAAMVGVQYATSAGGMLLGGMVVTACGAPRRRIYGVLVSTFLGGICLSLHGLRAAFVPVAASGFVLFTLLPVIGVCNRSLWQAKVPPDLQGRCSAVQQVLSNSAAPLGYFIAGPLSEFVFEPQLVTGGMLAGSLGRVIGVGPGRGIALLFIVLGVVMMSAAVAAYSIRAIRHVDELPDAISAQHGASHALGDRAVTA